MALGCADALNVRFQLANFMRGDIFATVGTQQPAMHLFLRMGKLPPAKITDELCAVRHRFERPQPHHAGQRRRIKPRPIHRTRLLFHHPPAALCTAAIEIVVKCRDVGMALAHITQLFVLGEPELLQKSQRITVPTGNVEIMADGMMIKLGKKAHEIMHNISPRRTSANNVRLRPIEPNHLIGGEPPKIQQMRWICFGHRQIGQLYLIKTAILHAPKHIAPRGIQRVCRRISICKPATKRCAGGL